MNLKVRKAVGSDMPGISEVVVSAFGDSAGQEIVDLVADLLADPSAQPLLSLVATSRDTVVGHILFTNARIQSPGRTGPATLLAPLAVQPKFQNQGIGGRLVREGLNLLKTAGVELAFVLGYPDYYTRYGFSPAGEKGFEATYPIPPQNSDAWMVLELLPGVIGSARGKVICADALNNPKYWQE